MTIEGNLSKVPPMPGTTRGHILQELQDVIATSTIRKNKVNDLIKLMKSHFF